MKYYVDFFKMYLPGGESNPGLPRDRRGYLPLYYRGHTMFRKHNGFIVILHTAELIVYLSVIKQSISHVANDKAP